VVTVSVITPAWNAADFLAETLDSVLAQTFRDWEMLVVDDGSTDETAQIVSAYARTHARIRLLRQPNAGPSAARNRGMRHARGRFFAFLDSDDRWAPRFLEAQLGVFERHAETALVTGNGYVLGGPFDGRPSRPLTHGHPVLPLTELIANESAVFIMTVFRREVFETIGGLDEGQWRSEDYDFWLRAAIAGFILRRNPEPLGWYRVRGNSLSRDRARMIQGILDTFAKIRPLCAADPAACAALDAQVARFESERLLEEAKSALERGDAALASDRLTQLRARNGGVLVGITAWLAQHLPLAAVLAYRLRSWRRLWPGGRAARRIGAGKEVVV
jgi:glycosyltransferase involved in cell wall biosynthesis